MNELAQQLLSKLLLSYERSTTNGSGRTVSLLMSEHRFPAWFQHQEQSVRDDFIREVKDVQDSGYISIEWVPGYKGQQIQRVHLRDANGLAERLKWTFQYDRVASMQGMLAAFRFDAPNWLIAWMDHAVERWENGKKPLRCDVEEIDTVHDVILAVCRLEREGTRGLDIRTLSVEWFRNTKRLECIQSKIAMLYRECLMPDWELDDILVEVGLTKFPLPFLFKGPIDFATFDGAVVPGNRFCYSGLPADQILSVILQTSPAYILSIENLTSFNLFTRRIRDNGVVVFTNGFPNRTWLSAYKKLVNEAPATCNVYHWGDFDVGGLRILTLLQRELGGRLIQPHLMSRTLLGALRPERNFSDDERRKLTQAVVHPHLSVWASDLAEQLLGPIEQENVTPIAPQA